MFAAVPRRFFLPALALLAAVSAAPAESATLSLDQAQARALAYSPLLQAADLDRDALLARRDQAGRRPNPGLGLDSENFAGSGDYQGFGGSEVVISVSQNFDLAGRRGRMQALLGQEATYLEYEKKRSGLDLELEVELAFAEVWLAQGMVELAQDRQALAQELADEITVRLAAGGDSPIDLTRAQVGVAAAEVEVGQSQDVFRSAARALASFWGAGRPDFDQVAVPEDFWLQSTPPVTPEGIAANPDLTRWAQARSVQDAQLALARAASRVDLEVALGVKLDNATGDRALTLGAGIPLPISDRNQDELRALGYERESLDRMEQDAVNRTLARLAEAVAAQGLARREITSLHDRIIPLARQAYDETHTAHQRGLYGLTEVLETRRTLFELRQAEMDAKHRFLLATAHIDRLMGRSNQRPDTQAPEAVR